MKAAAFLPNHLCQCGDSSAPHTKPGLPCPARDRPTAGTTSHTGPALTGLKDSAPEHSALTPARNCFQQFPLPTSWALHKAICAVVELRKMEIWCGFGRDLNGQATRKRILSGRGGKRLICRIVLSAPVPCAWAQTDPPHSQ